MAELTLLQARALFDYDPATGVIRWRVRPSQGVKPGDIAGRVNTCGHIQITYRGETFLAHRIAWLITRGYWPQHVVDHRNRNPADNRILNLRVATTKQNNENKSLFSNNTSGYRGVSFDKKSAKWRAYIGHHGEMHHLGFHDTAEAAAAVAAEARATLFTHNVETDVGKSPEGVSERTAAEITITK